ncbi:2-dehydro-3-deoxygalactonokinase [Stenotrophomonas bentonitica]|uniref:2-dehydro-3-deoxygalactonokinase n=1 Tax=Stenotrophomonas bentonitica TaxID=1450134 RepID=UPI00345E6DC1
MSAAHDSYIIGINWGSTNFRAYRIGADGAVTGTLEQPRGIAGLERAQMQALLEEVVATWPQATRIYASGMIGSNIGWSDAGYVDCPASPDAIAGQLHEVRIGAHAVAIVPGLACRRSDGAPDIMRGEETELLGMVASGAIPATGLVALPGTHSKWVRLEQGVVVEFMTAMSGEIFDRLTAAGLLASVVDGPAHDGAAFVAGVQAAQHGTGLGTLLFGARARVIRGDLPRTDGAAYLRGLLIGAELADVQRYWGGALDAVPLVGAAPVCALYARALQALGGSGVAIASQQASTRGFLALHRAAGALA